jgi:DNA-directed RNA polymerase I subunit RPA1
LAGHGGANVTLGIPRLREIIMTASATLKTPIMEVPLAAGSSRADAERIASTLNRLTLTSYISSATCRESMAVHSAGASTRLYTVRLNILPMSHDSVRNNNLTFDDFRRCFERSFCVQLNAAVSKQVKNLAKGHAGTPVIVQKGGRVGTDRDEGRISGAGGRSELDAVSARLKSKHSEHASYDEPDAEDEQALAAAAGPGASKSGDIAGVDSDSDDEIDRSPDADAAKTKAKSKAKAKAAEDAQAKAASVAGIDNAAEGESEDVSADAFNVLQRCSFLSSVTYDPAQQWLECVVQVSLSVPKLLLMSMVENVLPSVLLRATPRIAKSFVVEKFKGGGGSADGSKEILVQTEGVNFPELYRHQHLFDVTRISSNDIAAILRTYGVEAARASIVREVTAVFKVYGISIDPRHLGLVADYMTFHGGFRPLNRAGIDSNPSPFQKISFETSIGFLINACLFGDKDFMSSPSSRIVMGRPVGCGTGSFDLLNPLPHF